MTGMQIFIESLRSALMSIRTHRMRSFLTSLGIIIGVASVITVIALIQGLAKSVSAQFEGMGGNSLSIQAKNEYKDVLLGKFNKLPFSDVEHLRAHVDGIASLSPAFAPGATDVRFGNSKAFAQVMATTPSYQDVHQRYARLGRFIGDADETNARRVAVIGEKLIETLNLNENPIGQFILFSGEWFRIIGVMEKRGEIFGMSQDDFLIIPYKTGQSLIGNDKYPELKIYVALVDIGRAEEIKSRINQVMRKAHKTKPGDKPDFEIESSDHLSKSFSEISSTITIVMGGVVGIALLVGGIGIMNIMLVSVTERTREIGICKAIGARAKDILMQFLIEAVVISLMGGLVGVVMGYLLAMGIALLIPGFPTIFVPWWAVCLALIFSGGVGIVFGVIPANRAAALPPIEALRYE